MRGDDSEFIARFRLGDIDVFNDVYKKYYNAIYLFANNIIDREGEAQDIVCESFVKLWHFRSKLQNLDNIKRFLYLTTRNACFDFRRDSKRQKAAYKEILFLNKSDSDDIEFGFDMIKADFYNELSLQIENLPKQCAEVFKLIFFEGKKTFEIAGILGISKKTVLSHKRNAIIYLRAALLKKGILTYVLLKILLWYIKNVT